MSDTTKIEWADATWNPWEGCTKISEGCANCYAAARNHRFGMDNWGKGKPRRRTSAANWKKPLAWQRQQDDFGDGTNRKRIFPSLCDFLDEEVPINDLADFLKLIHDTPHLDWLLLTKRPENWRRKMCGAANVLSDPNVEQWLMGWIIGADMPPRTPANIWIGTSVENQRCADKRIPELLKIPAKVRFLSVEPLLERVVIPPDSFLSDSPKVSEAIHWVIVGGESGPGARPCDVNWIWSIVRQCNEACVPCFVKQLGSRPYQSPEHDGATGFELQLKHPKGGDPAEWPADLRGAREFPKP